MIPYDRLERYAEEAARLRWSVNLKRSIGRQPRIEWESGYRVDVTAGGTILQVQGLAPQGDGPPKMEVFGETL